MYLLLTTYYLSLLLTTDYLSLLLTAYYLLLTTYDLLLTTYYFIQDAHMHGRLLSRVCYQIVRRVGFELTGGIRTRGRNPAQTWPSLQR